MPRQESLHKTGTITELQFNFNSGELDIGNPKRGNLATASILSTVIFLGR